MGEFATYRGEEIKIGTCEKMYFLRFEDIKKIKGYEFKDYSYFFRLPFPDEDKIEPGYYEDAFRTAWIDRTFEDKELLEHPGNIQLHSDVGLHVNAQCFHGLKLPEESEGARFFWNGKSNHLELAHIKVTFDKLGTPSNFQLTIKCKGCGSMWSYIPDDILPYLDKKLSARIQKVIYNGMDAADKEINKRPFPNPVNSIDADLIKDLKTFVTQN